MFSSEFLIYSSFVVKKISTSVVSKK